MEITKENLVVFQKKINEPNTIVLYYAEWCPHCVVFKPEWKKFNEQCNKKYKDVNVLAVEHSSLDVVQWNTRGKQMKPVTNGFPTIKFYNNGIEKNSFEQKRDIKSLLDFVKLNLKTVPKAIKEKKVIKAKLENIETPIVVKKPIPTKKQVPTKKPVSKKTVKLFFYQ